MHITLNGEQKLLGEGHKLINLIEKFILNKKGIAIAVNDEVVGKDEWDVFELKENDTVLIITATQGG